MLRHRKPSLTAKTVEEGGTGVNTPAALKTLLGTFNTSQIGEPGQLVPLEGNGRIIPALVNATVSADPIKGPTTVFPGSVNLYGLTRYSSFNTYAISVSEGSVSRTDNIIQVTAPSVVGTFTLTVNGKSFEIQTVLPTVQTPEVVYPAANSVGNALSLFVVSTAMSSQLNSDTVQTQEWQLSTNSNFTTIAQSASISGGGNFQVTGLAANTFYYARTRFYSVAGGVSDWSPVLSFKTRSSLLAEIAKLSPPASWSAENFGKSIDTSTDGTVLVVSAQGADSPTQSNIGRFYIFRKLADGFYYQEADFTPGAIAKSVMPVAVSGDGLRVIVGTPNETVGGYTNAGGVYVYVYSNNSWTLEQYIAHPAPAASDNFGVSVDINSAGDTIVIGCPNANRNAKATAGVVYCYHRVGSVWSVSQEILNPQTTTTPGYFGYRLKLTTDGTRMIVSAPYNKGISNVAYGVGYIFTATAGVFSLQDTDATLTGIAIPANSRLGDAVTISDNGLYAAIASPLYSLQLGLVCIYKRTGNTWSLADYVTGQLYGTGSYYGAAIAFASDGSFLVVGEYQGDADGLTNKGAAYIHDNVNNSFYNFVTFSSSDGAASALFGLDVHVTSDTKSIFIGANGAAGEQATAGAVYVFKRG